MSKPDIIPQDITRMAEELKKILSSPTVGGAVIMKARQTGKLLIYRLAKETEDIPHEIINPLKSES